MTEFSGNSKCSENRNTYHQIGTNGTERLARDRESEHCSVPIPVPFSPGSVPFPNGHRESTGSRPGSLILAIDPGTQKSGWCSFENGRVIAHGVHDNHDLLKMLPSWHASGGRLALEMIASYGMAVGREVFETCVWIGRFMQTWPEPEAVRLVYRRDIKLHLCGTPRAKDANIRQALLDKVGPQGVKAHPGPTYGVKSHAWAALAVAVMVAEVGLPPIAPARDHTTTRS